MERKNKAWLVLAFFAMAFLAGGGAEGARDVGMKDGAYHPQNFWDGLPGGLGGHRGWSPRGEGWGPGGLPFGLGNWWGGGHCCGEGLGWNRACPGTKDKGKGDTGHEHGPPGHGGYGGQVP